MKEPCQKADEKINQTCYEVGLKKMRIDILIMRFSFIKTKQNQGISH